MDLKQPFDLVDQKLEYKENVARNKLFWLAGSFVIGVYFGASLLYALFVFGGLFQTSASNNLESKLQQCQTGQEIIYHQLIEKERLLNESIQSQKEIYSSLKEVFSQNQQPKFPWAEVITENVANLVQAIHIKSQAKEFKSENERLLEEARACRQQLLWMQQRQDYYLEKIEEQNSIVSKTLIGKNEKLR